MAIVEVNGRPRSVRTDDEIVAEIEEQMGRLSPAEKAAALELIDQISAGDYEEFNSLMDVEYERAPVGPLEFLLDDYYIGAAGSNMWPKLQEDYVELFSGGYSECILGGAIGYGKSFFSSCAMAYIIYRMSCMRDPHSAYGLAPGSSILLAMLSMTKEVARRVLLAELHSKIEQSPYFHEVFPFKFASTMYEVRFPKRITVVGGSTTSTVIGGNVFSAFIDEASFMQNRKTINAAGMVISVDRGEQIYTAIMRRMKSRFQKVGKLPGVLFLVSSKERPVAFVERRIEEAKQNHETQVFVREYAPWDVKPPELFSGERFKIAVGNDRIRSTLDPDQDMQDWYESQGLRVIEIPQENRLDFEQDLEGALRDVAGIATEAISLFIHRLDKVESAVRDDLVNPVGVDSWIAGTGIKFHWGRVATQVEQRIKGGLTEKVWVAKRHPGVYRYVHVDPSLTGDSLGIAIAHVAGETEVVRRDMDGVEYTEYAPVFETDFLLSVKPPSGDEIFLGDIRSIIYQFVEHGFPIAKVTLDRFQSADMIQQLRQRGIEAEVLSVDRTPEPYEVTKSALYEDRVRMLRNEVVLKELRQLQRVPRSRGGGTYKVDHPDKGTKDLADALAGVVYSLSIEPPGQPIAPMKRTVDTEDPDTWVSGGTRVVRQAPRRKRLPFVRG